MRRLGRKWSTDVRQIDLDVNRTYRDHSMFRKRYDEKQRQLFHILGKDQGLCFFRCEKSNDWRIGIVTGLDGVSVRFYWTIFFISFFARLFLRVGFFFIHIPMCSSCHRYCFMSFVIDNYFAYTSFHSFQHLIRLTSEHFVCVCVRACLFVCLFILVYLT